MKDIYIYGLFLVLIAVTGAVSYSQGVNNGKFVMCEKMGLQYGKSLSGDMCLTALDVEQLQNPHVKNYNLEAVNFTQWPTT